MPSSRITTKRLHILYTTPLILGLGCFFLIWIPIFGLVPWKLKSTTVLIVEYVNTSDESINKTDHSLMAPTLYFGLLGSCYQQNKSSSLECTKLSFPADYTTTISRAGPIVNSEHLQISMPDLPPVFGVWALISLLGSFCHLIGSLPFYFFNQLNHLRFLSKPFFSASLWILGIGWAFGFSAVLSLACFIQGFGDEYIRFSSLFILNFASSGEIFYFLTPALFFQILIILSLLVSIENSPTKNKEAFADSWSNHMGIHSP